MDFFLKYQQVIFRTIGILVLVIGFSIHFWETPKKGLTENEKAAINIARMEAKAKGSSSLKTKSSSAPDFLKTYESSQEKQKRYFTILMMILGIGLLGYSFIKKIK